MNNYIESLVVGLPLRPLQPLRQEAEVQTGLFSEKFNDLMVSRIVRFISLIRLLRLDATEVLVQFRHHDTLIFQENREYI